jgi:Flp pilus assembly protein TadD
LTALAAAIVTVATPTPAQDRFQTHIPELEVSTLLQAKDERRAGNSVEAAAHLYALTQRAPDYYLAHYNLALVLAERGDLGGAIDSFNRAIQIRDAEELPEWTIFNSAGWAHLLAGDLETAERLLWRGVDGFDKLDERSRRKLLNNLGLVYVYKREFDKARPYLKRAADEYKSDLARKNLLLVDELERASNQSSGGNPVDMSRTCRFSTGPKAGQIQHFGVEVQPALVGSTCTDGQGSFGRAIRDEE